MPSMFDSATRVNIVARIRQLAPNQRPLWGRMTAPEMVAHLTDQMRHTLGDAQCRPVKSVLRNPILRYVAIYVFPWPRGRVKGPPDAFVTKPANWATDIDALIQLVERFGASDPNGRWPNHAIFGPLSGRTWGFFCHKHFDHHLRQFGE